MMSTCFAWLNNPVSLPMGTADSHGLAAGTFNLGPGGVHLQFGLQAVVLVSPLVLSNGVRVTVGGAL